MSAPTSHRPNATQRLGRPRSRPITTLAAGDRVIINIRARRVDAVNQWAGEVLAVDSVAIRLRTHWFRIALSPCHAEGERLIPWSQVESVKLEEAA